MCVYIVRIWLIILRTTCRLGFCPVYTFNGWDEINFSQIQTIIIYVYHKKKSHETATATTSLFAKIHFWQKYNVFAFLN
jgi:hypothetical protein